MGIANAERLACYALALQAYFSCPALSLVSSFTPHTAYRTQAAAKANLLLVHSSVNPNDPGPPPFPQTQQPFDSASLPPPEELPDDLPKDVSNEKLDKAINSKEKTLYQILGASPTATRAELKKKYAELARLSHPDALIGRENLQGAPDFGEVSAAWRILGDAKSRKRYDRELQYKEWSAYASQYANEKLEEAVPAVAKIMDDVAVPFIRRTAATTFAVSQAVSKLGNLGSKGSPESTKNEDSSNPFTDAFMNAFKAGQKAGRAIDRLEIDEKSDNLSEQMQNDEKRAKRVAEKLAAVTEQRLLATLQSENLAITSDEARILLNRIASASATQDGDRAQNFHRIEKEIESLQETEQQFVEKLKMYEEADREWNKLLDRQEAAKISLTQRKQEEFEARRRLEEAIRLVSEAKAKLVTTATALNNIEQHVRRNAAEMDRVTFTLSKKQERVRHSLRKKVEMVKGGIQLEYLSEVELAALRRKEEKLATESEQLSRMAARLSSRAEKLKSRADALDRQRSEEPLPNGGTESQSWNGAIQT